MVRPERINQSIDRRARVVNWTNRGQKQSQCGVILKKLLSISDTLVSKTVSIYIGIQGSFPLSLQWGGDAFQIVDMFSHNAVLISLFFALEILPFFVKEPFHTFPPFKEAFSVLHLVHDQRLRWKGSRRNLQKKFLRYGDEVPPLLLLLPQIWTTHVSSPIKVGLVSDWFLNFSARWFIRNLYVLTERLTDWLMHWIPRLIAWLIEWLVVRSIDWLIVRVIHWSSDVSIDWLIDWWIDWFVSKVFFSFSRGGRHSCRINGQPNEHFTRHRQAEHCPRRSFKGGCGFAETKDGQRNYFLPLLPLSPHFTGAHVRPPENLPNPFHHDPFWRSSDCSDGRSASEPQPDRHGTGGEPAGRGHVDRHESALSAMDWAHVHGREQGECAGEPFDVLGWTGGHGGPDGEGGVSGGKDGRRVCHVPKDGPAGRQVVLQSTGRWSFRCRCVYVCFRRCVAGFRCSKGTGTGPADGGCNEEKYF